MAEYSIYDIIALFVSILLPPLGVLMKRGLSHGDFWLNIILTFLGWLPGLFHAFYIVYKYRDESSVEEGRPMLGEHPHTIKIHSTDSPPSQYQSEPQYQQPQQQYQSHNQPQNKQHDKYNTPPSTPPPQMNYEDTHAGPSSNEVPPAYDNNVKGEADSYYNDRKVDSK